MTTSAGNASFPGARTPGSQGWSWGRRGGLWVSVGVAAHTLWTSAAPALAYRLFATEWHLTHLQTTGIFAAYPLAVVATLGLLGGLSDQIGRRATMLLGVLASLVGTLLFSVAPSVVWLCMARGLMGIGVGLSAGPSTAAILEFSGKDNARAAASLTTAAQAVGFSVALLSGGFLIQYGPEPMRLSFWLLAFLLVLLLGAIWFLPVDAATKAAALLRPTLPAVPRGTRKSFAVASLATMVAFTHGVMILSLGGETAHDLVGSPDSFVNGAVLSSFPIFLALATLLGRRLGVQISYPVGAVASATGMLLLVVATRLHELAVFLLASSISGVGYSLLFVTALGIINASAPAANRGSVLSALYLVGYVMMSAFALIMGAFATKAGFDCAINVGAFAVAAASLSILVSIAFVRPPGGR